MDVGTFNLPLRFIVKLVLLYEVYRVRKSYLFLNQVECAFNAREIIKFLFGYSSGRKKKKSQLFQNN